MSSLDSIVYIEKHCLSSTTFISQLTICGKNIVEEIKFIFTGKAWGRTNKNRDQVFNWAMNQVISLVTKILICKVQCFHGIDLSFFSRAKYLISLLFNRFKCLVTGFMVVAPQKFLLYLQAIPISIFFFLSQQQKSPSWHLYMLSANNQYSQFRRADISFLYNFFTFWKLMQ